MDFVLTRIGVDVSITVGLFLEIAVLDEKVALSPPLFSLVFLYYRC
jgi:hypothetical protein